MGGSKAAVFVKSEYGNTEFAPLESAESYGVTITNFYLFFIKLICKKSKMMKLEEYKIYKILSNIALKIYLNFAASLLFCFVIYLFLSFLLSFLVFCVFCLIIFYNIQDSILFHPNNPPHSR